MNGNALWQTLIGTIGPFNQRQVWRLRRRWARSARFGGLEQQFKNEFSFDPSTKAEEIEGSISQALILMNNPQINQKIKAQGQNLLARVLAANSEDDEAVRVVYLRTLARRPTDRELARCNEHIRIGRQPRGSL